MTKEDKSPIEAKTPPKDSLHSDLSPEELKTIRIAKIHKRMLEQDEAELEQLKLEQKKKERRAKDEKKWAEQKARKEAREIARVKNAGKKELKEMKRIKNFNFAHGGKLSHANKKGGTISHAQLKDFEVSQCTRIVSKFGGPQAMWKAIEAVSPGHFALSTICRWGDYVPTAKGEEAREAQGVIPHKYADLIMKAARYEGILLSMDDFYPGKVVVRSIRTRAK